MDIVVPMDQTMIKTLYVFVEIGVDSKHLEQTIRLNFPDNRALFHESLLNPKGSNAQTPAGTIIARLNHLRIEGPSQDEANDPSHSIIQPSPERTRLALVSTIQFVAALQQLKEDLSREYSEDLAALQTENGSSPKLWSGIFDASIPRSKPLSPGELLGCTAPPIGEVDALMCVICVLFMMGESNTCISQIPWRRTLPP